jgi:amino acid transporter
LDKYGYGVAYKQGGLIIEYEFTNSKTFSFIKIYCVFWFILYGSTTLFATYGVAVHSTNGMISTAYIVALLVMLFTAYSYAQMVKALPTAGAAYTFTQKSLSPNIGFLAGSTILLDYVFSPMLSSLFLGIAMKAYFPSIPMYIWIIIFILTITVVNILGITVAAKLRLFCSYSS